MYVPTVEVPEPQNRIRACGASLIHPALPDRKEIDVSYGGSLVPPKMRFWERFKYLFTGKVPKPAKLRGPIEPPPVKPGEIAEGGKLITSGSEYAVSYTSFAGCDMKLVVTYGLGDTPTMEELLYAAHPSYGAKTMREAVTTKQDYRSEHARTIGEAQAISLKTVFPEGSTAPISVGEVCFILFDKSIMKLINEVEGSMHLVLLAANEYGDLSAFALTNFRPTSWRWGISIDDLISEEWVTFEADEPIYWDWITNTCSLEKEKKNDCSEQG